MIITKLSWIIGSHLELVSPMQSTLPSIQIRSRISARCYAYKYCNFTFEYTPQAYLSTFTLSSFLYLLNLQIMLHSLIQKKQNNCIFSHSIHD